jgi:hypothetical protein
MNSNRRPLTLALGLGIGLLAAAAARAETRIEKHLALDPGGRFTIESQVGSIVVRGHSASGVSVVVTSGRDDLEQLYDFSFQASPGEVRVSAKKRGGPSSWFSWSESRARTRFEISVPRRTAVAVHASGGSVDLADLEGSAQVRCSGGSIAVQKLAGALEVHGSGGAVDLREIGGNVRFSSSGGGLHAVAVAGGMAGHASGGSVEVEGVRGDLEVSSSGGGVRIHDAGGRVIADSSGGSVAVAFATGNGKGGTISSSGGSVRVQLDPSVGLDLSASSSEGGVTCDLPVTVQGKVSRSALRGVLHGGGEKLTVRSSGGGVRLAPL